MGIDSAFKSVKISRVFKADINTLFTLVTDISCNKMLFKAHDISILYEQGSSITEEGAQIGIYLGQAKIKTIKIEEMVDEPDYKMIKKKTWLSQIDTIEYDTLSFFKDSIDNSTVLMSTNYLKITDEPNFEAQVKRVKRSVNDFFDIITKMLKISKSCSLNVIDSIIVMKPFKTVFNWFLNPFNLQQVELFDSVERLVDLKKSRNYLVKWKEPKEKMYLRVEILENIAEEAEIKLTYFKVGDKEKVRSDSIKILRFADKQCILMLEITYAKQQKVHTNDTFSTLLKSFMRSVQNFFEDTEETLLDEMMQKTSLLNIQKLKENVA